MSANERLLIPLNFANTKAPVLKLIAYYSLPTKLQLILKAKMQAQ